MLPMLSRPAIFAYDWIDGEVDRSPERYSVMPSFEPANPDYKARVQASFVRQGFMAFIGA
jgi:hypothetical protein